MIHFTIFESVTSKNIFIKMDEKSILHIQSGLLGFYEAKQQADSFVWWVDVFHGKMPFVYVSFEKKKI